MLAYLLSLKPIWTMPHTPVFSATLNSDSLSFFFFMNMFFPHVKYIKLTTLITLDTQLHGIKYIYAAEEPILPSITYTL